MAERRMFAKTIVTSDAFLDMPIGARCLYFTLGMFADDDGFVNNPKAIMKQVGASDDDMRVLVAKKFILPFESGVIVIKHWRINNYLRNDRYQETKYFEEKSTLEIDENGAYTSAKSAGIPSSGIPSIGKVRLVEDRIIEDDSADKPRRARGEHGYVKLTDEEYTRLVKDLGQAELNRVIAYVDESAKISRNKNKWSDWNLVLRKASRDGWGAQAKRKGGKDERSDSEYESSTSGYSTL